jgi:hypothetical protein
MVMASNLRSGRAGRPSQSPESNDRNVCVRRYPRGLLTDFQPGGDLARVVLMHAPHRSAARKDKETQVMCRCRQDPDE